MYINGLCGVIAAPYAIGSQHLNDLSWFPSASDGDPSTPAHAWTRYNVEKRPTMILGPKTGMADDPDGDIRVLLAPMLKYSRETTFTHGGLMDAWHATDDVL